MSSLMHFDSTFSFEKSISVLKEVVSHFDGDADVTSCLVEGDWARIVDLSTDYLVGSDLSASEDVTNDILRVKRRRQCLALFSKNASLPLHVDRSGVALHKFLESEAKCLATNRRFRNRSLPLNQGGLDAALVYQVQCKIADILGPFPGVDGFDYGFGPGANIGLSRFTSIRRKLSASPTCTTAAFKYVKYLKQSCPHWEELNHLTRADAGKYASVPKNAKTDRSILIEPMVNSYLQKGVGSYIRDRLTRFGIDLRNQKNNQDLAYQGSVTGEWATIDLAAASDTISKEVVAQLLPIEWWLFLEDIRTQSALLPDGREICLQKFSSMGNGFTFELESLLFFAISSVIAGRHVSVYGDDIIVPNSTAPAVMEGLVHFGFEVNTEKSFWSGPFRESCGCDFFRGYSVRPCYVKGLLSVKEIFRLHNFFVRSGEQAVAELLKKYIPARFLIYGPDGFGDGHLIGDHELTRNAKIKRRGYAGYTFSTYVSTPLVTSDSLKGDYAAFLYNAASKEACLFEKHCRGSHRASHLNFLGRCEFADSIPSSSMYQERGGTRYKRRNVYTLG